MPQRPEGPRSHQQSLAVRISALFRIVQVLQSIWNIHKREITYFLSNPLEPDTVINDVYLIFYLTFKIMVCFVDLSHALQEHKAWKDGTIC